MQKYYCNTHQLDIVIYVPEAEIYFIDDNKVEVAIFQNAGGSKYLKRYVMGRCDSRCLTIQGLLQTTSAE